MKNALLAGLLSIAILFSSPAFAEQTHLSRSQLKECIYYYDEIDKKEGNIERLGEVMDEAGDMIDSYDHQLDRVEQALSHTIGYKRSALIQEYNSLIGSRKKFLYAYNLANDKRNKRIRQYKSYANKYDDQCVNVTVSRVDLDEVCGGKGGFCSVFN